MDARSVLGVQRLRPPFLDDLPAAEAGRCSRRGGPGRHQTHAGTARRARAISHQMSRGYVLEYPVDDPDEDEDDDFDEDDDEDDDEDGDDEEIETWQVSVLTPFR